MMHISVPSSKRRTRPVLVWRIAVLSILNLLVLPLRVESKTTTGDFKLNGAQTEHVLGSFALVREGGPLQLKLSSPEMYENEQALKFRVYKDSDWPKFLKSQLCSEKRRLAYQTWDVSFDYKDKAWRSQQNVLLMPKVEDTDRTHYWYFVMDDCTLEVYLHDAKIPVIHYEIQIQNYVYKKKPGSRDKRLLSHLSADEMYLRSLHIFTMVLSGGVAFMLIMNGVLQSMEKKKSVHISLLWVAVSALLDSSSSLFELMHLQIYHRNGVGSYFLDAVAAHLEAACDATLVLFLLSIAAGWTLPSSAMGVNPAANSLQSFIVDMAKPMGAMLQFNAAGILGVSVIVLHVVLAQWGRTYNDDSESYHDMEHLPGKILMFVRVLLGVLFLAATVQTRDQCRTSQLKVFYFWMGLTGFAWFMLLPFVTWICNIFVPYYLRHPAVFMSSALLQSLSLMTLAWLVTAHSTAYHEVSRISTQEESLGDLGSSVSSTSPSIWKIGKAKIRLD